MARSVTPPTATELRSGCRSEARVADALRHSRFTFCANDPTDVTTEFLDRIRADPDDDRLREVYADWLLENGDPLGEFIALQLKRARSGTATPVELERERVLLNENWFKWTGPLAKALHRDETAFERGFLSKITIPRVSTPKKLLRALAGDPIWATARTVRNVHLSDFWVPILIHPVMRGLRSASMEEEELLQLEGAPWRLTELVLRSWSFAQNHLAALSWEPFKSIRRLELQATRLDQLELLAPVLPRLEQFQTFLGTPGEGRPLLQFLARGLCADVLLGTRTISLHAKAGTIDLILHDAIPPMLENARLYALVAKQVGLKPGSVTWAGAQTTARPDPSVFTNLGFTIGR